MTNLIVREPGTEGKVWWGQYNRPYSTEKFDELFNRVQGFLQGRDLFVQDCYAGADPDYRLPVRIITELAWHSMFARNMFLLPGSERRIPPACPGFYRHRRPVLQGFPADRWHPHQYGHCDQFRAEAVHHRQHRLCR